MMHPAEPDTDQKDIDAVDVDEVEVRASGEVLVDEEAARAARRISRLRALAWMLLAVVLAVGVRLPLLSFPMGQEAGAAGYVGRRWISGAIPYRDVWDFRPPALYLMSGLVVRVLGPSAVSCRLAMVAIDLGTVLLVYYFVRQWCNRTEAVTAAGLCGFFGGAQLLQGDCLSADHPMTFLVALSMVAALRSQGRRWGWVALSGLAGGLAACFRPVAVVYVVGLMLWLIDTNGGARHRLMRWVVRPAVMLGFALVPAGAFAAYFWWQGALPEAWRNLVEYGVAYHLPAFTWSFLRRNLLVTWRLASEQAALWLFAGGWVLHAFSQGFRRETALVAMWSVTALAGAMLAREVQSWHFLQTVAPLAIGAALAVTNPSEKFVRWDARGRLETRSALLALFAVALALGFVYTERRAFLNRLAPGKLTTNRAAERVAALIRDHTTPRDKIYVWGTRPQVYVLADRPAAHPIFYNFELNLHTAQVDTNGQPQYIVDFFDPGTYRDIYETLVREQPCFVVTTERYVPEFEKIKDLGPIWPWFHYMLEQKQYDLWQIIVADPFSFTIFARQDRAGVR